MAPTSGPARISVFRVDPFEPAVQQGFRIANVRVAADDAPSAQGFFQVKWEANDPDATVRIYYDTDTDATSGRTMIASGLSASDGSFNWDMVGVPVGRYWSTSRSPTRWATPRASTPLVPSVSRPWSLIPTATACPTPGKCSSGSIRGWRREWTAQDGDPDGDGRTNLQEYQDGTHPAGDLHAVFGGRGDEHVLRLTLGLANPCATTGVHVAAVPEERRDDGAAGA